MQRTQAKQILEGEHVGVVSLKLVLVCFRLLERYFAAVSIFTKDY